MDKRLSDYLQSIGADSDSLDGWEINTAQRDGEDVAFVIICGPEIHFVSIVGKRAMTRKNIGEYLGGVIEKHGFATTRVSLKETDHKLREVLGFVRTWSDADYSYWMTTKAPFTRSKKEGG
jgi:hypothetical protein